MRCHVALWEELSSKRPQYDDRIGWELPEDPRRVIMRSHKNTENSHVNVIYSNWCTLALFFGSAAKIPFLIGIVYYRKLFCKINSAHLSINISEFLSDLVQHYKWRDTMCQRPSRSKMTIFSAIFEKKLELYIYNSVCKYKMCERETIQNFFRV